MDISSLLGASSGGSVAEAARRERDEKDSSLFARLLAANSQGTELPASGGANGSPPSSARLATQLKLAQSISASPNEPVNLQDLQSKAEAALTHWQQQLVSKLQDAGIALDEPLRLLVRPGDGKIVVQGDHPKKDEIEAILNRDAPLADSIRDVSAMFDLLRAAAGQREFAQAYEKDPVAAVKAFAHLLQDDTSFPLEFRIDQYGAEAVA